MANVRKLRNNSKASSTLCKECNMAVKDDDRSGICCHSCNDWTHGGCVDLSVTDVEWLGSKPNCFWVCNSCVHNEVFTNISEDKLTSLFDSSVAELIPNAIDDTLPNIIIELNEKVKTAVVDSLPSYKDVVVTTICRCCFRVSRSVYLNGSGRPYCGNIFRFRTRNLDVHVDRLFLV